MARLSVTVSRDEVRHWSVRYAVEIILRTNHGSPVSSIVVGYYFTKYGAKKAAQKAIQECGVDSSRHIVKKVFEISKAVYIGDRDD